MWLLRDSNGKIRYLKPGTTEKPKIITIGRKQSDIVLGNDTSISRAHSTIQVILKEQANTSERASTCIVKDANSKYGTHIIRDEVKVKASTDGFELKPFDTLQFGLQQHVFKVEYIPIVAVISRLNSEHKDKLKKIMNEIGGLIAEEFDNNCTHLTATTATCTTKVISAIIAGIPVVNIKFWIAVLEAIEKNEKFPDPADFTLSLQDKGVNTQRVSLKPNPGRKSLFQGRTFIFFSEKVCKEYSKMIKDAGGTAELYNGDFKNIPEKFFANNNLVMQVTVESLTDDLGAFNTLVYDKMQEKKLRMISETEIPLAILYASLDQYCNPKYHFKDLIKRKSLKKDESKILALDTQDIAVPTNDQLERKPVVCLPETQPKDETNLDVNPQFPSENNLSNDNDIVQRINPSTSDKKLTKTVVNMDSNRKEKEETNESSDLGNKTSLNFRLKRASDTALESDESKKRKKGKTNNDEMNKNVQNIWKSKKFSNSSEETKKESSLLTKSKNDFDELEHRSQIKEEKQDKLSKWGFKKIAKKSIDFDLDDFEEDEPKQVSQKTVKPAYNSNRNRENTLEETIESQKPSQILESYKGNKNLQTKSFNDNKNSKENMDKNWTAFKAPKSAVSKSSLSTDNVTQGSLLVRPSIKVEEVDNDVRKASKTFKKAQNVIPIKRIALADMTVWRPNS